MLGGRWRCKAHAQAARQLLQDLQAWQQRRSRSESTCGHCHSPRPLLPDTPPPFHTLVLQVAGNFPLYGVCWYVTEMLHRAPALARGRFPTCGAPFRQCLIAAPRCYCLLSHYPFFDLHFKVGGGGVQGWRVIPGKEGGLQYVAVANLLCGLLHSSAAGRAPLPLVALVSGCGLQQHASSCSNQGPHVQTHSTHIHSCGWHLNDNTRHHL